ncbi:hypothetical protein BSNK01_24330 [Bacillaceae bacterium]
MEKEFAEKELTMVKKILRNVTVEVYLQWYREYRDYEKKEQNPVSFFEWILRNKNEWNKGKERS